jgi:AcrR family transcriptional regulator
MPGTGRVLSRREAKEVTRRRMLTKALELLEREGEAALTPSAVARAAGVAQSTFYVHFRDREDLLHEVADWLTVGRNRAIREARRATGEPAGRADRVREAFRLPLEAMIAHPSLFRVSGRLAHEHTELGRSLRKLQQEDHQALVEDLISAGYRAGTEAERHTVEIVADAFSGLLWSMARGVLDGRYTVDEALDVIMRLVRGLRPFMDLQQSP